MEIRIRGGEHTMKSPQVITLGKRASVSDEIDSRLSELTYKTPTLIQAQTGLGKTYMVLHTILPWTREQGRSLLFVSSRVAINTQVKKELLKVTGQEHLEQELTEVGLQAREDFDGISVVSYQKLYHMMISEADKLKKYGILVFDEVHALLEDALFVPHTGYVLDNITEFFGSAIRLYMSATPGDILPLLAKAESPYQITVLQFHWNYSFVVPFFFKDSEWLVQRINQDTSEAKWLIFVPSITQGEQLKGQIHLSVRLLNGNERTNDPESWNTILREARFNERVCIATAVVDAGVNFKDELLQNVVVFSCNPNTIVQFFGRKRRKGSEKVNLYVHCPSYQDLTRLIYRNEELARAVDLYKNAYPIFIQQHILQPQTYDLRNWVYPDAGGILKLNSLVSPYLVREHRFLEELIEEAEANEGDCCFDEAIADTLGIYLPDRSLCWLDPKVNGDAKIEFETFLAEHSEKQMGATSFSEFCIKFRDLHFAAFGPGKTGADRKDRDWGVKKVSSMLKNFGYNLYKEEENFHFDAANIHQKNGKEG